MEKKKANIALNLSTELLNKLKREGNEMKEKKITIRLELDLYEKLKKISIVTGFSITTILILAIWLNFLKIKK